MNLKSSALVIGASSRIGGALIQQLISEAGIDNVIAVSRKHPYSKIPTHTQGNKFHFIQSEYDEPTIRKTCEKIRKLSHSITRVCICNGILHNEDIWPEKKLEELNAKTLEDVFTINTVTPILWVKNLLPLVKSNNHCVISVFSARIGSIDDNRSGGWYSYRASKAALNMLLKTAAVEYARRATNVKLIAFHPGTTDTPLSEPFQRSVKKEHLLRPEYVAKHLVNAMKMHPANGECSFIDWENKPIAW